MFFVYVISSLKKKYLYVGITNSLERRFSEHQNKKEGTTRTYSPFILLHSESFKTRQDARNRERFLKSGSGKEWLKKQFDAYPTDDSD